MRGALTTVLFLGLTIFWVAPFVVAQSETIQATVQISVCGNASVEGGEQCDGANLAGHSCSTQGFDAGTLSCLPACIFDTSLCTESSSGGSGSSGGSSGGVSVAETYVSISGRAYPGSRVVLLKDGQIAIDTTADPSGSFSMRASDLSAGSYTFGVYAYDLEGEKSNIYTFPVTLTEGTGTTISSVFLSPTISTDKISIKQGENLVVFGQTAPNSQVTLEVNSHQKLFYQVSAGTDGVYLYNLNTAILSKEQHSVKTRAELFGEATPFSRVISFSVGDSTTVNPSAVTVSAGDVNKDSQVNLIDFSIAAFWYKKSSPPASVDLNKDGVVNIIDLSILAFYWTG